MHVKNKQTIVTERMSLFTIIDADF